LLLIYYYVIIIIKEHYTVTQKNVHTLKRYSSKF